MLSWATSKPLVVCLDEGFAISAGALATHGGRVSPPAPPSTTGRGRTVLLMFAGRASLPANFDSTLIGTGWLEAGAVSLTGIGSAAGFGSLKSGWVCSVGAAAGCAAWATGVGAGFGSLF